MGGVIHPKSPSDYPILRLEMLGGFRVEFYPTGNGQYVQAARFIGEGRMNDHTLNTDSSDEDLRKCLTPEGTVPAINPGLAR